MRKNLELPNGYIVYTSYNYLYAITDSPYVLLSYYHGTATREPVAMINRRNRRDSCYIFNIVDSEINDQLFY